MLIDMGFTQLRAEKALVKTSNAGVEVCCASSAASPGRARMCPHCSTSCKEMEVVHAKSAERVFLLAGGNQLADGPP